MQQLSDRPEWLKEMYDFESHYTTTPLGHRQHYLDEGKGDPVLFVHGNPTWSFFYREPVRRLSKSGLRCIAVDHIGCGFSDKPQDFEYTLENHISNLVALIEKLNLRKIRLVVHDWGGAIGLGAAGRMPERFEKITILNTGAFRSEFIPRRIALCKLPMFGRLGIRGFNLFAGAATITTTTTPLAPEVKKGFLLPYDNWKTRIATHEFVRDIPMNPAHRSWNTLVAVEENLQKLQDKSIRIIWGMQDWCFTDYFLKKFREIFPQAPVSELTDAGHYLIEDCPDRVCDELLTHFK